MGHGACTPGQRGQFDLRPASLNTEAGEPAGDGEALYRLMRLIRRFEERVVDLVNSNEIAGVTHEYVGQEAVAVGVCTVLRDDDVITSTHRGHGHVLAKGAEPRRMMAELMGRTTGTNRGRGGSMHIADLSLGIYGANGIVGAGAPFALGAAWVARQERSDRVAVTFFGDGAINQGVLHESMNLAAVSSLPVLFVCEDNGYAVTMPAQSATAGSIVGRAAAYGMPAESVNGMDVDAVKKAASTSVLRARSGSGPSFLHCATYRYFGHHTAERTMGLNYRSDNEVEEWRRRDPLTAAAAKLDPHVRELIDDAIEEILDEAVEFGRSSPRPNPADALSLVYADGLLPRGGA